MIFSLMQMPLGMRIHRIGKRIYVHGVPLSTTWFCPYCCATVDTAFVALGDTGGGTNALLPCLIYWLLRLSAIPQETCGLHRSPRYHCQLSRLANWGRDLLTQLRREPRNRQADEQTRTAVLISLRVYFSTF
jgi:hypothetical protein